jgi:polyphosphate kinase
VAFPLLEPRLQDRVRDILEAQLADTVKARRILADGTSAHVRPPERAADERPVRSQERVYELLA